MKIVVPLAYTIRGIPRGGKNQRDYPMVELIEWDLRELTSEEAPVAMVVELVCTDPWKRHDKIELREVNGSLIRTAGGKLATVRQPPLKMHELPVWRNGSIESNYIVGFLELMPFEAHGQLFQEAMNLIYNKRTSGETRSFSPEQRLATVISHDRDEALERTRKRMASLFLVNDILWIATGEPTWRIDIGDRNAFLRLAYDEPPKERDKLHIPLVDDGLLASVAEAHGAALIGYGRLSQVSENVRLSPGGAAMMLERAARRLLNDSAQAVGEFPADLVTLWVNLRDAVGNPGVSGAAKLRTAANELVRALENHSLPYGLEAMNMLDIVDQVYGDIREPRPATGNVPGTCR